MAQEHYLQAGHKESRVYKRLQVLLRYTTCGNVMQQHYSHMAGLTLAVELGADVMLPPAIVKGANMQHGYRIRRTHAEPFSSLWDYENIVR